MTATEAFTAAVSQGRKHAAADYDVIRGTVFHVPERRTENLYLVENHEGLAEMNSALNSTGSNEDYVARCDFRCRYFGTSAEKYSGLHRRITRWLIEEATTMEIVASVSSLKFEHRDNNFYTRHQITFSSMSHT